MSMPKTLKLILLSIRDLVASAGPVVFLVIGLLIAAYWWLQPQPPRRVTLATGPAGSAYAEFGQRYARALATNGIEVVLKPSEGSSDNLQMLRNGTADVGFVRGGSADVVADEEAGLSSLGSLFYEPLWIFYRSDAARTVNRKTGTLESIAQLKGLRVNVDKPGSGVPEIMERMLRANHLDASALQLSNLEQTPATEALQAGLLDVIVLASAPQSPLVQQLLRAPGIALMDLAQSDAYSRRFPFLQAVSLPRGVVDLARDVPTHDVSMLAATTSLLAREQTHPALRQLFAQSAQTLHGDAGWFNRARDFPNTRTSELPVSPEGDRAINGTPPFWQRYLPFWASNLIERMWLVLGGLVVLMLPLSRVVPPLYQFRVRSRVFRWYGQLRDIETQLESEEADREALLTKLDDLDRRVNKVAVPLSYADELYALRNNIAAVRQRVQATVGVRAKAAA
ncbi:TAXI family TRAP transporter solute-binding subunit [Variovorax arabinosiphilus]|uniref:TAXI family TRAP transporter solute-binding subunit n=1 Tax=Variovorax arabinosiphilus TaxID=3053498 RepID=UPI00257827E2|nr:MULTISPECIES: TAXI family TRAP transporter solute-binding subunit [unclassified Variovorax]MDM0122744.1 TAXI family TRAP transporter solute-binding subunit [Variovorax sp. J2L1-78]MDM0132260.1 TAXI family TRAP transporter solute-binding subunit [Variovorax sp. J2L1-63]MDM0235507.1 TAXI family TRAP transporter solute-binding subunit [Variovorax sp. J2R1-6]